jgi:hypothetical protein
MVAPVALFCFRRPVHLGRTLFALAANHGARDHDLVAFADGPRDKRDLDGVAEVRGLLAEWAGRGAFRSFSVRASQGNQGLRGALVSGVSEMTAEAGTVIVVEDDMETSPWFLRYCDDGLEEYADEPSVASIHGYCYPVANALPPTFFLRGADCWGWATWRRAWETYDGDAGALLGRLHSSGLADAFNQEGARDLTGMLAAARDGSIDSWAVRWHAAAFLAGMHTLYPGRSLVRNIGLDASGTHGDDPASGWLETAPSTERIAVEPIAVRENPEARQAFREHFLRNQSFGGRLSRVLRRFGAAGAIFR